MTQVLTSRSFAGLSVIRAAERPFTFNLMLYGDAGVGKTWFAGSSDSVPAMRKVLALDCESGANTLKAAWPNVDLIQITKWDELTQCYNALSAGGHGYQTVIIDSMTEVNDHCIDLVRLEARAKRPDRFDEVLEVYDWNKVSSRMLRMMRLFRDLPLCTIFVAHMVEERDERTGKLVKQPLLSGKLKKKIPAIPDIILYQFVAEIKDAGLRRCFLTTKTETCVAKTRGVTMPTILGETENVSMRNVYDYVEASKLRTEQASNVTAS